MLPLETFYGFHDYKDYSYNKVFNSFINVTFIQISSYIYLLSDLMNVLFRFKRKVTQHTKLSLK